MLSIAGNLPKLQQAKPLVSWSCSSPPCWVSYGYSLHESRVHVWPHCRSGIAPKELSALLRNKYSERRVAVVDVPVAVPADTEFRSRGDLVRYEGDSGKSRLRRLTFPGHAVPRRGRRGVLRGGGVLRVRWTYRRRFADLGRRAAGPSGVAEVFITPTQDSFAVCTTATFVAEGR